MNTASIRLSYRPMRLGLCVVDGATDDLRKAVKLTSTLWGGRFNPIIPVGGDPKLAQDLMRMFHVDLLLPVSQGAAVEKLVRETKHLPWSRWERTTVNIGTGEASPVFLDVYHPMTKMGRERHRMASTGYGGGHVLPNLLSRFTPGNNPSDDAVLCTLGDYLPEEDSPLDYGAMADQLLGCDYPNANGLASDYWNKTSPLSVTEFELIRYRKGSGPSAGVYVGDPARHSDLVSFWNLRAAGVEAVFLPNEGYEELLRGAVRWITRVQNLHEGTKLERQRGHGAWSDRSETQNWALHGPHFNSTWNRYDLDNTSWDGRSIHVTKVQFEDQSALGTVDESNGKISIAFSLPPKNFSENIDGGSEHLMVTMRRVIDPNPSLGTFQHPFLPQLNQFYGREVDFEGTRARIEPDGLGVIVKLSTGDLHIKGIPPQKLVEQLFALAGIETKPSPAGKVAMRVIQHMGGIDSCRAFKIRGVRDLLLKFSRDKHFSRAQALPLIGANFDSFKRLFIEARGNNELTPQDVFLHLVRKKVFRPGIVLECPTCLLSAWHSVNDLAEQVTCSYCGSSIDIGPQLHDGCWEFRVSGVFARSPDHEGAIPVTLALMQTLRCLSFSGMTWLTGTDMSWPGLEDPAETDLVVITQSYEHKPQLIIGECKTKMQISAEQLDKLLAAAARFDGSGIEVFIMLAKAAADFTEEELNLIKARQSATSNFILLTPRELEPYEPYETVELEELRNHSPLSLEEWAHYSHVLYLKESSVRIATAAINDPQVDAGEQALRNLGKA
jgi:hypothetical protein